MRRAVERTLRGKDVACRQLGHGNASTFDFEVTDVDADELAARVEDSGAGVALMTERAAECVAAVRRSVGQIGADVAYGRRFIRRPIIAAAPHVDGFGRLRSRDGGGLQRRRASLRDVGFDKSQILARNGRYQAGGYFGSIGQAQLQRSVRRNVRGREKANARASLGNDGPDADSVHGTLRRKHDHAAFSVSVRGYGSKREEQGEERSDDGSENGAEPC
jgi:hypothetical protein